MKWRKALIVSTILSSLVGILIWWFVYYSSPVQIELVLPNDVDPTVKIIQDPEGAAPHWRNGTLVFDLHTHPDGRFHDTSAFYRWHRLTARFADGRELYAGATGPKDSEWLLREGRTTSAGVHYFHVERR